LLSKAAQSISAQLAQVWYGRADVLDGAGQIGSDLMIDLGIGRLLRRTEQPGTRIADSSVVWTHAVECIVHQLPDGCGVCEVDMDTASRSPCCACMSAMASSRRTVAIDLIASDKEALRH
jgi:hypothetical protein